MSFVVTVLQTVYRSALFVSVDRPPPPSGEFRHVVVGPSAFALSTSPTRPTSPPVAASRAVPTAKDAPVLARRKRHQPFR